MTARSSRNCVQATGHDFHWLSWSEQETRSWPNDSGRLQTGLFGVALPFKLQKKGDPSRQPRDVLRACPAMEPTAQPNGHVWATCGPATGSPTAGPKLGTSRLNLGMLQALLDGGPLFVAAQASAKVSPWICSDHRASRDCVIATGQPSYWRWMASFGHIFLRGALERRRTGLFGPRCRFAAVEPPKLRASLPMAPTIRTTKRGTVWPFGRLEHWWLGSAPNLGCDGAVTAHK